MRYFKPTGTLNDISGGTLTSGLVPLDRCIESTQEEVTVGDTALANGLNTVLTIVPSSPAVGDLYLVEITYDAYRAAGSAGNATSFGVTGTVLSLRSLSEASDMALWSGGEGVLITQASYKVLVPFYVGRMGTWTALDWRLTTTNAGVTLVDGASFKLHKIGRA